MTHKDLIRKWGSEAEVARALGNENRQMVNRWKKEIPIDWQIKIEVLTNGELRANLPKSVRAAA